MNLKIPHPLKNGKGLLVDYNLAIVMLPSIISGVSVGAILHKIFPELIINVCYILLLAFLLSTLFKKFLAIRNVETAKLKEKEEQEMKQVAAPPVYSINHEEEDKT